MDAEIYVYVAKKGAMKISGLNNSLSYSKEQISSSLKSLKCKALVREEKKMFFALPFEEALILLIEEKKEQAQDFNNKKEELLVTWNRKD